ncbi:hypothetical protein HDU76_013336 [Blyttiomyces sp. JEL0837]|nr:hypothetical protein HDU76_013336 [Blyttiomyces sp. JEL0837]
MREQNETTCGINESSIVDLDAISNVSPCIVSRDATAAKVFKIMRTLGLRHVLVADLEGFLYGMVTRQDFHVYNGDMGKEGKYQFYEVGREVYELITPDFADKVQFLLSHISFMISSVATPAPPVNQGNASTESHLLLFNSLNWRVVLVATILSAIVRSIGLIAANVIGFSNDVICISDRKAWIAGLLGVIAGNIGLDRIYMGYYLLGISRLCFMIWIQSLPPCTRMRPTHLLKLWWIMDIVLVVAMRIPDGKGCMMRFY